MNSSNDAVDALGKSYETFEKHRGVMRMGSIVDLMSERHLAWLADTYILQYWDFPLCILHRNFPMFLHIDFPMFLLYRQIPMFILHQNSLIFLLYSDFECLFRWGFPL
jgi:hypothetical protein